MSKRKTIAEASVSPTPQGGRPRKVTDDIIERICVHIEAARPFSTACHLEGVKPDTLKHLMADHEDVRARIDQAKAVGESTMLAKLGSLIEDDKKTTGLQWWMEKLYPKRWGRNAAQRIEQTGANGGPMEQRVVISIEDAIAGARGDDFE